MTTENNMHPAVRRHRSTFSVLFYINRTKVRKDGSCQLLCKVSIDSKWEQIGTKVSVNPALWNPATGRADGRSENALVVNRAIDDLTERINRHYRRIRGELGFVSAELVKNALKGIGQKPLTLLALFREHNDEFRKRVGVDRTRESWKSYLNSYNHLASFVEERMSRKDVALRSLDKEFYDSFDLYLRKSCHMKAKSVHEHLYRLKKMTMRAVNQGTLRRDPYARLHPELPKRESRHLRLDDLQTILATPVEQPNLRRVRDWFIFSTFTGLAYADLKRLCEDNVTQAADGTWWIHIRRKKTDTPSVIRLLDVPLRIIEKYRNERKDGRIFNLYARNYLIKLTKRLGKEYGINLTFHMARHNFGTHVTLSQGIPIETVSRMMGHKSVTTTQIYAHVTDGKVDEDMKILQKQMQAGNLPLYEQNNEDSFLQK